MWRWLADYQKVLPNGSKSSEMMFLMISEILTAGADRFFLKMLTFVQFLDLVLRFWPAKGKGMIW